MSLPASVFPFCYTAVVLVFACWVLIAYGYWLGRYRLEVTSATYTHPMLPAAFDGYKIVHISDLHLETFADRPAALQRIVDSINAQEPDLICFMGDMVTIGVEEVLPFTAILQQLHAGDAVLSVLGNHDLMIYRDIPTSERLRQVNRLVAFEQDSLGWRVLCDTSFIIVLPRLSAAIDLPAMDTLTILGVDNCSCEGQVFAPSTMAISLLPCATPAASVSCFPTTPRIGGQKCKSLRINC